MENEHRRDILDISLIHLKTLGFSLFDKKVFMMLSLLDLLIWPLLPTSKGIRWHLYPFSSKSDFRAEYLVIFLKFAASMLVSKLQVNSNRKIVFFHFCLRWQDLVLVVLLLHLEGWFPHSNSILEDLPRFQELQAFHSGLLLSCGTAQSYVSRCICLDSRQQGSNLECDVMCRCYCTEDTGITAFSPISSDDQELWVSCSHFSRQLT